MIEYRDFERLAARYSDGEATEGEDQSVRDFLLADRRAQGDLQRLDAERQWISKAFARRPEDLSRLVIKVRQRNPHRRGPVFTL